MNLEQLKKLVPSAFAEKASGSRSKHYKFYPTSSVIELLINSGWAPTMATEKRSRSEDRIGYQKHLIRFREAVAGRSGLQVGDCLPEIVLTNSHDGSTAYQIHAGIFRLVCSNGLVVADTTFKHISILHKGFEPEKVLEATHEVVREVPQIMGVVREMESVKMTESERLKMARKAIRMRFKDDEEKAQVIKPEQLLVPRRTQDQGADLWTTFNVIQENMIRGGLETKTVNNRASRTREIRSINLGMRLNKGLWELAENTLKKAA